MKKAALVIGARPQFIKTAPLVIELGRFFNLILIHTGQHYDFKMSGCFFDELNIPMPNYHLGLSWTNAGKQTGRMIEGLDEIFEYERPDFVVVIGDTNSTLAGALAASKKRIPVVHIEAGVRSRDRYLPEQINRVITDSIAECFLCPTPSSVINLNNEGKIKNIYDTGDILYDCVRFVEDKLDDEIAGKFGLKDEYSLITVHRAELTDSYDNMNVFIKSLSKLKIESIFPMHPRTKKMITRFELWNEIPDNVNVIDPVGYLDLLALVKQSKYVITDSGGIQREAAYFSTPVFLARPETEWVELVNYKAVKIINYNFDINEQFEKIDISYDKLKNLFRPSAKTMAEQLKNIY